MVFRPGAGRAEGRVHEYHVEALPAEINEPEPPRRVFGEESPPVAAGALGLLAVAGQGRQQCPLGLGPALLVEFAKETAVLPVGRPYGGLDALLDVQQRPHLSGRLQRPEDLFHERGEPPVQRSEELPPQVCLGRHGLGHHDVGPGDRRALPAANPQVVIGPLGTQPQSKRGDLGGARVDVDAMEVVAEHESRNGPAQVPLGRIVLPQIASGLSGRRPPAVLPGFLIDAVEEVECVEKEVTGPARRVQDLQVTGVLRLPPGDKRQGFRLRPSA